MQQEVTDWKRHPITSNFYTVVQEAVDFYRESLSNVDSDFDEREIARKVGVIQGLEALLTYEPILDEETGEVIDES
jgi:hypothetical protein